MTSRSLVNCRIVKWKTGRHTYLFRNAGLSIFTINIPCSRTYRFLCICCDWPNCLQTTGTIIFLCYGWGTFNAEVEGVELKVLLCLDEDDSLDAGAAVVELFLGLDVDF